MKKITSIIIASLVAGLLGVTAPADEQKRMSVQVKQGAVRTGPSFLAKIIARLDYGDQVTVTGEQNSWSQIAMPGVYKEGWIHSSALSAKQIVLKAGASNVEQAASDDELILAGRGFNREVEQQFRSENPGVDFTWIDRMEAMNVSQDQIQAFIKAGALNPQGGGQ